MVLFKEKKHSNKDRNKHVVHTTIENKHNDKIKNIKDAKKLLPQKKQILSNLKQNMDELSHIKNSELNETEIEHKLKLKEDISILEKEIKRIEDEYILNDYLLNTSHMLFMYFDENDTYQKKSVVKPTTSTNSKKTVLDFFKTTTPTTVPNPILNNKLDNIENTINNVNTVNAINNQPNSIPSINNEYKSKGDIMEAYLSIMDKNYVKRYEDLACDELDNCKNCNEQRIYSSINSVMICPKCGFEEKLLIDSETPSYKEPPREITYFAYKKINHFNEWLSQFQAKESTDIPEDIFEKIESELKKELYINKKTLKASKVRDILKKLNLTKYYEHCPYITNRITGKPAPEINDELQEKLRNMFRQIQGPWNRHCPNGRSNFFSYPYIFYKFLQLLGHDEFLPYFRLLKSREKLQEHDEVWKKICEVLKWEFIKTV
jgi:hypothetical protein